MVKLRVVLFTLLCGVPFAAKAHMGCQTKSAFDPIEDISDLMHKTGIVGEPDRMIETEFAAANREHVETIRDRYAATGDFKCSGFTGGGQLTVRNDVITTAAHNFYNDDCTQVTPDIKNCTFTVTWRGEVKTVNVKEIIDSGWKCPGNKIYDTDDWMVLRLDKAIVGPRPYRTDRRRAERLSVGNSLVVVGKSTDFRLPSPAPVAVKHYGACKIEETVGPASAYATDCDSSFQASGSSVFSTNENDPALVGIIVAGPSEDVARAQANGRSYSPTKKPYGPGWRTIFIPVKRELANVLDRLEQPKSFASGAVDL